MQITDPITAYLQQYWGEILAVIIGGAILSIATWAVQRYYRPRLEVRKLSRSSFKAATWTEHPRPYDSSFGWLMRNKGHQPCYAVNIIIVLSSSSPFEITGMQRLTLPILPSSKDVLFGFDYVSDTSPPEFEFGYIGESLVDFRTVEIAYERKMALKWSERYMIRVEYHFSESDTKTHLFHLRTGESSNKPVLEFNEFKG